jgi:hypothetical protein
VCPERINDWYETHQTVFGLKEGCISKLDRCNDREIWQKILVNKIVETPVTSAYMYLLVDCLELNILIVCQTSSYIPN